MFVAGFAVVIEGSYEQEDQRVKTCNQAKYKNKKQIETARRVTTAISIKIMHTQPSESNENPYLCWRTLQTVKRRISFKKSAKYAANHA
ncbi:CLUMA_CG012882, isoform A [Clunio marinus]|uniref:CLUMA_CG012882, isoform A n=1 Tax=Clunio marinus TaxID=568069 RepID=A0A1J1IH89_9DIPT|nr:CLUMA_CG012882, isoform A [Clunio marinus]